MHSMAMYSTLKLNSCYCYMLGQKFDAVHQISCPLFGLSFFVLFCLCLFVCLCVFLGFFFLLFLVFVVLVLWGSSGFLCDVL